MTKVRDDVRQAFEREQAGLGDLGDARYRLVRNAMAAREVPASRGAQWAAGIAAVVIAAIVIATFAVVRANSHAHPIPAATPSPKASVSSTPLAGELAVPNSTPVIVYHDPAKFDQVDGITWDGKASGKITGGSVQVGNPANNLFGLGNQIVDRHGNVVATGTYGAKAWSATWADDGTHFCMTYPFNNPGANGIPTTLQLAAPGQAPKNVARVGTLYNQTSVSVLACSVLGDRAVVVQSGGQGVSVAQYWVIQLSTGKILWTRNLQQTTTIVQLVVSRDGQYVAEVQTVNFKSTIYGPTGQLVANLEEAVEMFSWDGSLAVTSLSTQAIHIVRWSDSHIVWTSPTPNSNAYFYGGLAEPNGTSVAIAIHNPAYGAGPDSTGFTPVDLLVISGGGSVVFERYHVYLNG